jgi:23S rRNA pseudouridine1911/1915/1917 synthase
VEKRQFEVPPEVNGDRLDGWLGAQFDDLSRARIQGLIKDKQVWVNDTLVKRNYAIRTGDIVTCNIPEAKAVELVAEDIPLDIVFEDTDIIVINKASGLVVHPAPGNYTGTLVNGLLYHCTDLKGIGGELRPGIVHRLDKDTSGIIIVAKNEKAMNKLSQQFQKRTTGKKYRALVWGNPVPENAQIDVTIGRHPIHRKKMAADVERGRNALSIYHTLEKFSGSTLLEVEIKTGRTHQIRVHLAHVGHAVVGDNVYGKPKPDKIPYPVHRQMLHAYELEINHPTTDERMNFVAEMPSDMQDLLDQLRSHES